MDLKLECDDGEDLFLSQSAEQMEQDFERFEDNMLSQVADYMERDYCLEQVMNNYVPISGDFDLLDVNFDLGYLLPEQEDTKQDIKPDIKPESLPPEPGRFQVVSDDEMELLVQNQKNKNTGQNTKWALGVFNSWRAERNPNLPELLEMDPPTMNMALSRFVLEARKKTGEPYPGKTLYLICCGLLRHLRDYGSQINFLDEKDFAFCSFRKVLDSKMKELLSRGIGTEIKQAPAVLPQDEEKIWDTGVFGQNSSESLQYTMYFYNCKLFGLRAYDEHRDLTCEQFEIGRDSIGKYIHFVGKATKTFKGGLADKELKTKDIKHYCNDDMCTTGWCLNGGKCSGKNICTCTEGFYGERCNNSINNIEIENYGFLKITNNTLETPDGTFDVIGNVTMETNRKRDSHHHSHYGHAIHCQGHNSYVQYSSSHSHHYSYHHHHGKRDSHHGYHGTCMSNLGHHSHGFTTSAHVNFGHHHSSHQHHIYSSGGHLPGHQGAHCYYHNNHMHFHVTSQTHHWHVSAPCRLLSNQWHHVQTSWHPHTGVSLHVNGHHVGSSSHAQVNSKPCTLTAPLRLCNTHYTSSHTSSHTGTNTGTHTNTHTNPTTSTTTSTTSQPTTHQSGNQITININIQISGLSMIPVSQNQLNIAGLKGPYTPPPPTTLPPTTVTTTQPPTTTRPRVTATTTHSATRSPVSATTTTKATTTTTGPHRSVCYSCTSQNKIGTCQNKTRCQVGEVCTIFQDRTGYTSKCLDEQLCLDAKKLSGSSCWECCTSYLCNDHCQANANVTCTDKPTCSLLMSTGFDVCKDPQKAVDICRKSCNKC